MTVSLLSLGEFSSMILLKICYMPLTWNSPLFMPVIPKVFGFVMMFLISCVFLSGVLKFFHFPCVFGVDSLSLSPEV